MIKVSVISPIYNREQWVKNLLDNLQPQTLKEIEFIIIDDGSSDKTYELLQNKSKGDNRFQITKSPENKGPYHARNIGLAQAKGEYIGFFDCDDKISEDYFENLYEQAKAENADIVYGLYNSIPHRIKKIQRQSDKFKVLKNGAIWDKLYRKEYLDTKHISFTEGLYTADNLFVLQAFWLTDSITLVSSPNYEYTIQEDSIGKDETKQVKRKKDILEVLQKALVLRDAQSLTDIARYEYDRFLIRSLCDYPKDKHFQAQFYKILGIKNKPEKEISMKLAVLKFIRLFHLISKEKYNKKRQIELVKASGLFDAKWYLAQNPDVKEKKLGAAKHYVKLGWREGRNPSLKFDGNQYLSDYPEVAEKGICPLVHYIINGQREGRYYSSVSGERNQPQVSEMNWYGKLRYALEYPIRLQEECDRLKAEIKAMEQRG